MKLLLCIISAGCIFLSASPQSDENTAGHPNIGYDWDSLYKDDPQETKDSAIIWAYVQASPVPQITIKTIIDVCGKYFFRLTDVEIQNALMSQVKFNVSVETDLHYWMPKIREADSYVRSAENRNAYEQIWDDDINLYINFANDSKNIIDVKSSFASRINQIDTVREKESGVMRCIGYDQVHSSILKTKNDSVRIYALFMLAQKMHRIFQDTMTVAVIIETISQTEKSRTLNNIQKATFILGCAKFAVVLEHPLTTKSTRIYSLLLEAQRYIEMDGQHTELLKKARVITALYLGSLGDNYSFEKGAHILVGDTLTSGIGRASILEKYRTMVFLSICSMGKIHSVQNLMTIKSEKNVTEIASFIASAWSYYNYLTPQEQSNVETLHGRLLKNTSLFYLLRGEILKSEEALFNELDFIVKAKNEFTKYQLWETVVWIATNQVLKEDNVLISEWDSAFGPNTSVLGNDNEFLRMSFNEDEEFLNKIIFPFEEEGMSIPEFRYILQIYSRGAGEISMMEGLVKNAFENLASRQAKNGNWQIAYTYLAKADSLETTNQDFTSTMLMRGERGYYLPEKYDLENFIEAVKMEASRLQKDVRVLRVTLRSTSDSLVKVQDSIKAKDEEIAKRENRLKELDINLAKKEALITEIDTVLAQTRITLLVVGTLLVLIIVATVFAFRQRNKAKLSAKFNEYRSNIWQELGHLPGGSIDDSYLKLKAFGIPESQLTTLEELKAIISGLFVSIAQGDSEKGNELQDEVNMARRYIDYTNRIHGKDIELAYINEGNTQVPPALILSCARNAIQHGKLLRVPGAKIEIGARRERNHVLISVKNNGEEFPPELLTSENVNKKSTGFRNMENVLNYYNRKKPITNPVIWENIEDEFYTVQTTLRVRL